MIGSFIELTATTEEELKEADEIAHIGSGTIYIVPELIQMSGVARSLSNGRYKIYIMVDYPKGTKYAMDKFKGTSTDFFLADGYDVVLTPGKTPSEIAIEVKLIHSFLKQMVNPHVELCYTINASMRSAEEIAACAQTFFTFPPTKIKLESQAVVQPTKANIEAHKETIKLIRKYCTSPIVVAGNVDYKMYRAFATTNKIAVSPKQYYQMAIHRSEFKVAGAR